MKNKQKHSILLIAIAILILLVFALSYSIVRINDGIYFIFSKELYLYEKEYTDENTKDLKRMKSLERVVLAGTHITNIEFLEDMHNLKSLYIWCAAGYEIGDLSSLRNCQEIEYFEGINLDITDLSDFENLRKLKCLKLESGYTGSSVIHDSMIANIDAVCYLTDLQVLSIYGDDISDISALSHCSELIDVTLYGTNAQDYSVLLELPNLKYLSIDDNVLTDGEIWKLKDKGVVVTEYTES